MSENTNGASGGIPPNGEGLHHGIAGNGTSANGTSFKSAASHIEHSIQEFVPKLIATAVKIADVQQGRDQLQNLTDSAFGSKFGGMMKRLERELADLEIEYASVSAALVEAIETDAMTPPKIATSKENQDRDHHERVEVKFVSWQARHRFETRVLFVGLAIALASSGYTAWANLVGTGLPVFLDNPVLPVSMAALAPMASLAVKTMWHSLKSEKANALFTKVLNFGTLGLIASWAVLFATEYSGLGSQSVTAGLFDEESSIDGAKSLGFTVSTLLTEIAIGTALGHRLDKIADIYSPGYEEDNPKKKVTKARVEELHTECGQLKARILDLKEDLTGYPESLNLQVQTALLAYDARRAHVEEETL